MKRIINNGDVRRITKRVIKEGVDLDVVNKISNLEVSAIRILRAMEEFCEEAQIIYSIDTPEEDTIETEQLLDSMDVIDGVYYKFKELLDYYR